MKERKKTQKKIGKYYLDIHSQIIKDFWEGVDEEMMYVTIEKGRRLIEEAGVVIFPSWDISSAISFKNLRRNQNIKLKLSLKVANKLFTKLGLTMMTRVWKFGPYILQEKDRRQLRIQIRILIILLPIDLRILIQWMMLV